MTDYKNIGESRIRKMQKRRNNKRRVDLEFCTAAILITAGMVTLIFNW